MKQLFFVILFSIGLIKCYSQTVLPLYNDSIPNSKPSVDQEASETTGNNGILVIHNVSRPSMTIFTPPKGKANGTAVIICPGGSYAVLAAGHEGYDVARRLNDMGVIAFVLKYRIPSDLTMINKEIGPLQDGQRAIQIVRENAKQWGIDSNKIGIMGFSAGGHLASTVGTHFKNAVIENRNNTNLRPDFLILIYPVISFADSIAHIGSRDNLLGKNPSPARIMEYSNELQVTSKTPPTFLVHAGNDDAVNVQNSIKFYEALRQCHVSAELLIYPKGGHGFGLNNLTTNDKWVERLQDWMEANGWVRK